MIGVKSNQSRTRMEVDVSNVEIFGIELVAFCCLGIGQ